MAYHLRGSVLLTELLDAADHVERLDHDELRELLRRSADTLAYLLKQDIPERLSDDRPSSPANSISP